MTVTTTAMCDACSRSVHSAAQSVRDVTKECGWSSWQADNIDLCELCLSRLPYTERLALMSKLRKERRR